MTLRLFDSTSKEFGRFLEALTRRRGDNGGSVDRDVRVGIDVPGGMGAYPSSVLMNAIPARVAGVREIVMVSPASKDGDRSAALAAAAIAGVTEGYRIGGGGGGGGV